MTAATPMPPETFKAAEPAVTGTDEVGAVG